MEERRGAEPSAVDAVKDAAAARRAEGGSPAAATSKSADRPAASGAPKVTYATLVDRFKAAKSVDELDGHAGLIPSFPVDQAKELTAAYKTRRAELESQ